MDHPLYATGMRLLVEMEDRGNDIDLGRCQQMDEHSTCILLGQATILADVHDSRPAIVFFSVREVVSLVRCTHLRSRTQNFEHAIFIGSKKGHERRKNNTEFLVNSPSHSGTE